MKINRSPRPLVMLRPLYFPAAAAFAALLLSRPALAQTDTWNGGTADWNTAGNWSAGVPSIANGSVATFNGSATPTSITLSSAGNTTSIAFTGTPSAYIIGTTAGSAITLGDGGSILMDATVANIETVNAPLIIGDTGAAATYTFTNNSTTSALNFGGTITGAASTGATKTLVLNGTNTGTNTLNGVIGNGAAGGTLAINVAGSGTWLLTKANTYSGGTTVDSGTLKLTTNQTAFGTGAVTINSAGNVVIGLVSATVNNAFTGSGIINATVLGTTGTSTTNTTLGGNLSGFTGTLNIGDGTLGGNVVFAGGSATNPLSSSATINVNTNASLFLNSSSGGTWSSTLNLTGMGTSANLGALRFRDQNNIYSGSIILHSNSSIGGGGGTISGVISETGGSFGITLQTGSTGSVTPFIFSGANTYTGATVIANDTFEANNAQALGIGSAVSLGNNANAILKLDVSVSIGSLAGGGATGGNVTLGAQTLTTGGNNTNTSYAGIISGTSGNLIKTGTGTQTLTATSTYTGSTNVNTGTLALGSTGSISSSALIKVAGGATFDVSAVSGYTLGSTQTLRGAGNVTGAVAMGAGSTIAGGVDTSTLGTLTFSSTITSTSGGTFSLKINSDGTPASDKLVATSFTLGTNTATLSLTDLGSTVLTGGTTFTLLHSTSTGISGTFFGMNEGASFAVGANTYTISYLANSGMDVTLTVAAVPEPSTYAVILGALALVGVVCQRHRIRA